MIYNVHLTQWLVSSYHTVVVTMVTMTRTMIPDHTTPDLSGPGRFFNALWQYLLDFPVMSVNTQANFPQILTICLQSINSYEKVLTKALNKERVHILLYIFISYFIQYTSSFLSEYHVQISHPTRTHYSACRCQIWNSRENKQIQISPSY